jgi:hypothetical protein
VEPAVTSGPAGRGSRGLASDGWAREVRAGQRHPESWEAGGVVWSRWRRPAGGGGRWRSPAEAAAGGVASGSYG